MLPRGACPSRLVAAVEGRKPGSAEVDSSAAAAGSGIADTGRRSAAIAAAVVVASVEPVGSAGPVRAASVKSGAVGEFAVLAEPEVASTAPGCHSGPERAEVRRPLEPVR